MKLRIIIEEIEDNYDDICYDDDDDDGDDNDDDNDDLDDDDADIKMMTLTCFFCLMSPAPYCTSLIASETVSTLNTWLFTQPAP